MTREEFRSSLLSVAPAKKRRASSYYDGASMSKRLSSWIVPSASINSIVATGGELLRRRSRHVVRNNAWAQNAISSFVANAVGTGIKPVFNHPSKTVKQNLARTWRLWTDEADADGLTDFYGLQALACRSMMEGGECLARLRPRRIEDEMFVPLQVQLLEGEHLPFSKSEELRNGAYIRAGIEYNTIGRRVAYHLYRDHPEDKVSMRAGELVRVPASSVLHLYQPLRPGQQRGQPWLTTVLLKLHDLERYDDAELVRKKLAAMLVAVVYDEGDEAGLFPTDDEAEDGTPISILEPGTTARLRGSQRVEFSDPKDVGGMYYEFMRVQLLAIAAGLGITYEQLTNDLKGVTYSSIRAGLIEFRRRLEQFQNQVLIFQFCRAVVRPWLEAAALAGVIDARDYARNRDLYEDVTWRTPKFEWVDPEKDVNAEIKAVRAGFKSRDSVIHSMGEDPEDVDAESAASNKRAEQLELSFPELNGASQSGASSADNEDSSEEETVTQRRNKGDS